MSAVPSLYPSVERHKVSGQARPSTWIQAVSHLDPQYGGIASMLEPLCEHTEEAGVACPVLAFCGPEEYLNRALTGSRLRIVPPKRFGLLARSGALNPVKQEIARADGIHIHGIWESHCATVASLARSLRRPYVISAHGMLDRWALSQKRFKKALYASLIESRNLAGAACLRALTAAEARDYRRLGFKAPIAIVPNGVTLPARMDPAEFYLAHPDLAGKRIILFLGRLHEKKGLIPLLSAWLKVRTEEAHLVIAGPDDGLRMRLEQMVQDGGAATAVTFAGNLRGSMKWSALAAASLFALPSFSEGLSMALLEALAAQVPILFTPHCNLPTSAADAGWLVDADRDSIERALADFLQVSRSDLESMARRGSKLAAEHYRWDKVADQMNSVYRWLEGGTRPHEVDIII